MNGFQLFYVVLNKHVTCILFSLNLLLRFFICTNVVLGFVVHRGRMIPTLASMQEPLVPARLRQAKEKSNNDSKAEERGMIYFY